MHITLSGSDDCCRLTIDGHMTLEHASTMEDGIIDAMRRYSHLDVDLSGVDEIDRCGIHLLGLLQSVAGKNVDIVATSPAVERASRRLLASYNGGSLGRAPRKESVTAHP